MLQKEHRICLPEVTGRLKKLRKEIDPSSWTADLRSSCWDKTWPRSWPIEVKSRPRVPTPSATPVTSMVMSVVVVCMQVSKVPSLAETFWRDLFNSITSSTRWPTSLPNPTTTGVTVHPESAGEGPCEAISDGRPTGVTGNGGVIFVAGGGGGADHVLTRLFSEVALGLGGGTGNGNS